MQNTELETVKECTCILQELVDDAKSKNELELRNKYKGKLKIIHCSPTILNDPVVLYRARLASEVKNDITLPSTFSYVPLSFNVKGIPKRGRMNLSGQSFFYASFSPDTNYREIKKDVKAGDEVFLSQWEISANSGFSIYNVILSNNISELADKDTYLCVTDPHIVNGPIGDYLRSLSDIILMKEDNTDKEYLASSLISNKILIETNGKIHNSKGDTIGTLHYDAIAYPSTRIGNGEADCYNLAITPQFIDDYASLKYVVKGILKENLQSVDFNHIGFNHDGKIEWYEPYIYIDDVIYDPIGYITKERVLFNIEDVTARDKDGKIVSKNRLKDFLNHEKNEQEYKESIIQELIKECFLAQNLTYGEISDETSLIIENTCELFREVNGWKLERNNECHNVEFIKTRMIYKNRYKKIENIDSII